MDEEAQGYPHEEVSPMRTAHPASLQHAYHSFLLAVLEELLIVMAITCYVLVQGTFALQIWSAIFIAFSLHLIIHMGISLLVRSYTPGLATAIVLLPFAAYGLWSIWLVMSMGEILACGLAGVLFMVLNLRLAHWIGMKMG